MTTPERGDWSRLRGLLAERNQYPEQPQELDRRIRASFERTVAILALDMCGFSRITAQYGVIPYLAMIEQMDEAARPAVVADGDTWSSARRTTSSPSLPTRPRPWKPPATSSAHFGGVERGRRRQAQLERLHRHRLWPDPGPGRTRPLRGWMEPHSKLGEDLALPGKMLLTDAAHQALGASPHRFTEAALRPVGHRDRGTPA